MSLQQFFQGRTGLRAERSRARVMLSGKFLRQRLCSNENDRQIKVRIGITWILRDSLKDFLLCFLLPPLLAGRNTKVIVRGCAVCVSLRAWSDARATTSGPGSDQASLSGAAGAISGKGLALALSWLCVVIRS